MKDLIIVTDQSGLSARGQTFKAGFSFNVVDYDAQRESAMSKSRLQFNLVDAHGIHNMADSCTVMFSTVYESCLFVSCFASSPRVLC